MCTKTKWPTNKCITDSSYILWVISNVKYDCMEVSRVRLKWRWTDMVFLWDFNTVSKCEMHQELIVNRLAWFWIVFTSLCDFVNAISSIVISNCIRVCLPASIKDNFTINVVIIVNIAICWFVSFNRRNISNDFGVGVIVCNITIINIILKICYIQVFNIKSIKGVNSNDIISVIAIVSIINVVSWIVIWCIHCSIIFCINCLVCCIPKIWFLHPRIIKYKSVWCINNITMWKVSWVNNLVRTFNSSPVKWAICIVESSKWINQCACIIKWNKPAHPGVTIAVNQDVF